MAFTNYGYPYMGNYPGYPPPTNYTQPVPAPQMPSNGPDLGTVQTIAQVDQVSIQPGQRRIVMVQNEPVIAVRFADQMGLVSSEYYRLEKFNPSAAPVVPAAEYVTRKEFEEFVASIKAAKKEESE